MTEDVVPSLMPFLNTVRGDMWLLSTPFGRKGVFYESWEYGGPHWHRVRATALECGRIPRDMIELQRNMMRPQFFSQEYLCEFVDNGTEVFGRQVIEKAVCPGVAALKL